MTLLAILYKGSLLAQMVQVLRCQDAEPQYPHSQNNAPKDYGFVYKAFHSLGILAKKNGFIQVFRVFLLAPSVMPPVKSS